QEALYLKLNDTLEKLRPSNLIKDTLSDIAHTPGLGKNIVSTSVGLGVGYITNKLFNRNPAGIARKVAGTAIQLGISSFVARRMPKLKTALKNIFSKKKSNSAKAA